jgi:serine/threonine protein kinase
MSIKGDLEQRLQVEMEDISPPVGSLPARSPIVDGNDEFILGLITEIFAPAVAPDSGWHVEPAGNESELWVKVRKYGTPMPEQGWKLHVSAAPLSVEEVLRRALPVLLAEDANFKVISTVSKLLKFNSGSLGLSQIGKFITVFPNDDAQAVRLALALHEATRGLRGPGVPSDRPLVPGSLVHYRYGGYVHRSMQTESGEPQPAIRAPDGTWVPDPRNVSYSPPEWAVDPFLAAGAASPLPKRSRLIAGRYLITASLHASARGEVFLAVDLEETRNCVLKHAMRNGAMGMDGNDSCDRLRNEASVLARLAPDPRFPAPFGLVEQDGELYLAMEEVDGDSLYEHVRGLAEQGRYLPPGRIVTWARELTSMLGAIHAKGILYRDLKSSSPIVTPEMRLRLLDFDICLDIGAPAAIYSPGTDGYMSRGQRAHEAPRITHDIYSLGALLYFMATGAEPAEYSRPFDLLDRPLALMNPAMAPALSGVIERCLDRDPERRFQSMEALDAALAAIGVEEDLPAPGHASRLVGEREHATANHYRDLARQLGDALCAAASRQRSGGGLTWPSEHYREDHIASRNISTGNAGPLLALAELVAELGEQGEPRHREALAEGAHSLASAPPLEGPPLSGLYVGEAGIAVALLRAGQVLDDRDLVMSALQRGQSVATLPHTTPALFSGTAGRLRSHLILWDETGEPAQMAAAIEAGETLLGGAEKAGDSMLRWVIPHRSGFHSGRACMGYAIGAAGIGDALLDLFEVTGQERFLEAAQDAGRWLISLAMPALDDGSGLDWPMYEGEPLKGAHLGHGAAGVGRFFLHAAQLEAIPDAHIFAERAARTTALGARWSGPSQGYGLSGQIEFLLDMFQATSDGAYLDDALLLASLLEAFSVERDGFLLWPTESPTVFTPGYIAGYAGVAVCLLRLSAPERLPHHLSRCNFHTRRPNDATKR